MFVVVTLDALMYLYVPLLMTATFEVKSDPVALMKLR